MSEMRVTYMAKCARRTKRENQTGILIAFGIAAEVVEAMTTVEMERAMVLVQAAKDNRKESRRSRKETVNRSLVAVSDVQPGELNYQTYLQSDHWLKRRSKIVARAKMRCEECGLSRPLQVHHKSYERLGRELDDDLIALCSECHEAKHQDKISRRR